VAESRAWLLAIDTSTEITGLALFDGQTVSELTWRAGRNQTVRLLSELQHLLELNNLTLDDVGAVAVAVGPGTFNGLRVGLSTAKGISYARTIPIVGVNTLEATAYPFSKSGTPIRAFVPAGRGRTVFCDYRTRNGRWVRQGEMQNRPFEELTSGLNERTLVVGEVPGGLSRDSLNGANAELPPAALVARRPAYVAEIAHRRWMASDVDEIAALEPVYVHGARSGTA
jgi:tRNA threonylcarbamoyladenosine biosynthesis protein TsaB